MGNDEILKNKVWKKSMEKRDVQHDFKTSLEQATKAKQEKRQDYVHDKKTKQNMKVMLMDQMQKQQDEAESATKSTLSLEKKILGNASQFDGYVDDIIMAKREYLEKLRSQRPF